MIETPIEDKIVNRVVEKLEKAISEKIGKIVSEALKQNSNWPDREDDKLVKEFLDDRGERGSEATVATYRSCLNKFLKYLKRKKIPLSKVKRSDVVRFVGKLAKEKKRVGTIRSYLKGIRSLYDYLSEEYEIKPPNLKRIRASDCRSKVPDRFKRKPISKEEIRLLINSCKRFRDKMIILFLYLTGLRAAELTNLKLEDVCLEGGYVNVIGGKGGRDAPAPIKKNFETKYLVEHWLTQRESYLGSKNSPYFFVSRSGGKLSVERIEDIVHKAAVDAGIQRVVGRTADGRKLYRVTPHVLRHCFINHLRDAGVPLEQIKEMSRHINIQTTLGYLSGPEGGVIFESYHKKFSEL